MFISFRDKTNKTFQIIAICLVAVMCAACSEKLDPLELASIGVYSYGKVDARFCTSAPAPAQQKLKFLFILDHSASNKPGITAQVTDVQNTDADGSRRYGPMINFINNLIIDNQTTPYFNLIDFDDTAIQPSGLSGFESDINRFLSIATTDWVGGGSPASPAPNDSGFTNYQAALNLAYTIIQQDAQAEAALQTGTPITSVYQIIFVSDGTPTIQAVDGSLYTQVFTTDIAPEITKILDLKNTASISRFISNISLNTAYYFNTASGSNPAAVTLLQQMSTAGNGAYEQFATGQQILYQTFAPAPRSVVNQLVDVFVQNENAVWWDNGKFMMDNDSDGLPDIIEKKLGSNFYAKDSDGNGVNDLVEFRTKGSPCNSAACDPLTRDPYAMCAGYAPMVDTNNQVTFQSTSNDGLNDCEKFLMNGSTLTFNGNGNMIPDFLALVNTMSIQMADRAVALADPFGNGMNNYQKLKAGLPVQISSTQIGDFESRNTNLTIDSVSPLGVTCYHLEVNRVAMTGPNNKIKIYVVQNSSLIQDKTFLMTAEKSIDSNLSANFGVGDFN